MSKRKREDGDAADTESAASGFRRQRQIMATFTQSAQQLEQAMKLARGFERQKLGRRKKTARGDEKEISRIDAEVTALKSLDMARCAQNILAKTLCKIKAVREAPDLPVPISAPKAVSSDTAALNVYARLCNSNPVKTALPAAAAGMKGELGIEEGERKGRKKTASAASVIDEEDEMEDRAIESDASDIDVDDLERQLEQEGVARTSSARRSRREETPDDDYLSDASSAIDTKWKPPPTRNGPPPKKLFLPNLTMAGYLSGSGSDVSDDEENLSKPKKNRRGQRARQAIWEKKYGKSAKHVQEGAAAKQDWDPKRGAVSRTSKFAKDANKLPLGPRRTIGGDAAAKEKPKKPRKDDEGPLHPSWEAAKRAKEKKSVPVAFQGKKISFD